MMTYKETKRTVASLLAEEPRFEAERLPSAAIDHSRLMPTILSEIGSFTRSPEESLRHNQDYRIALSRAVSMECAGGAPVERCRIWFRCLASLAAWTPPNATHAASIGESAVWAALAGWFDASPPTGWPEDPNTKATPERVVYRLLTRKAIEACSPPTLFDDKIWEELCSDIETRQDASAARSFRALAAWWLKEYKASETLPYEPERFSTFEPAPNAALAIALVRDGMQIGFQRAKHERFYYVARMLARAQSELSPSIHGT